MIYLNRDERRETIMQAARQVALDEGLAAMTVRRIAREAGVATGQVHHHFTSAAELRAQTLTALVRQMMDAALGAEITNWHARLQAILGCDDYTPEPYIRLWREAQLLVNKDPILCLAYTQIMEMWHDEIEKVLIDGREAGAFRFVDAAQAIAWRLIALVCGLDGLAILGLGGMGGEAFDRQLCIVLGYEVGEPAA